MSTIISEEIVAIAAPNIPQNGINRIFKSKLDNAPIVTAFRYFFSLSEARTAFAKIPFIHTQKTLKIKIFNTSALFSYSVPNNNEMISVEDTKNIQTTIIANTTDIFNEWKAVSTKPMYLSEAGADSYMTIARDGFDKGKNEKTQARAVSNILDAILNKKEICSGVTLFAFCDEWWKAGNNEEQDPGGWAPNSSGVPYDGAPNEEYWGIVDIERNKKEAFDVVKEKFLNKN